jgi:hypothetical protein
MKRNQLLMLGITIILIASASSVARYINQDAESPLLREEGTNGAKFILNTELPKIENSYAIYTVVTPDITMNYVTEIAETFGVSGTPETVSESTGEIRVTDNTKNLREQVSVYKYSNSIVYEIPEKKYGDVIESQPDLPSEDEAKKIANEYLLSRDLLPDDVKVESVKSCVRSGVIQAGVEQPVESYDVTLGVTYSRDIDGIPVYGDEFTVYLGDKGEVVGVTKTLREIIKTGNTSIKSPTEAYNDLVAGNTDLPALEMQIDEITIDNISIGYLMQPRIYEQKSVIPVYVFEGIAKGNGKEIPYKEFVSAV